MLLVPYGLIWATLTILETGSKASELFVIILLVRFFGIYLYFLFEACRDSSTTEVTQEDMGSAPAVSERHCLEGQVGYNPFESDSVIIEVTEKNIGSASALSERASLEGQGLNGVGANLKLG